MLTDELVHAAYYTPGPACCNDPGGCNIE